MLYYLINEVLRHLRRTQRNMSDLIVQVLIRKLSNIRHIYSYSSTKKLEISSNRTYNSRNQMKAYDKLAELKHRFWHYSI